MYKSFSFQEIKPLCKRYLFIEDQGNAFCNIAWNLIKLVIWLISVESGVSQDIIFTWEEELSKFTLGKDLVSFAAKILN